MLLTLMVLAPLAAEVRTSRLMGAAPMALAHHAERQIEPPPPAPRCGHHVASIDARPLDLGADRAPAAWRTLDLPPPGQV
ncbi:MAG: hypothetical protein KF724_13490 [Phycisphaeraceae bacterium]|nr:hypothetical protein [Phycisphaeraceae bacterium]